MAERTSLGNTLMDSANKFIQQISETTDFNKLIKNKNFLADIKKLPDSEQFKIFDKYKDEFIAASKNSQPAITKWIKNVTQNIPNMNTTQETLNNGIQQGQKLLQDLSKTLGQNSQSSPK
jgi:hypothetical protein